MRERTSHSHSGWSILAGAALAPIVVCVIANFADIKRYVRISTM
jgi:hypothetical protein